MEKDADQGSEIGEIPGRNPVQRAEKSAPSGSGPSPIKDAAGGRQQKGKSPGRQVHRRRGGGQPPKNEMPGSQSPQSSSRTGRPCPQTASCANPLAIDFHRPENVRLNTGQVMPTDGDNIMRVTGTEPGIQAFTDFAYGMAKATAGGPGSGKATSAPPFRRRSETATTEDRETGGRIPRRGGGSPALQDT